MISLAHGAATDGGTMRPMADMFQPLSRPAEIFHESALLVLAITAGIFILVPVLGKFRRKGPAHDKAVRALLCDLTKSAFLHPQTGARLIYELA